MKHVIRMNTRSASNGRIAGNVRRILCASSLAAIAFSACAPAYAQDEAVEDEASGNEIIVTATKRERTLQDVPVAVSVTTAATLEQAQIRDLKDLSSVVPSLRVNQLQS
jgi:iron complex outermembrane receptor protein